MKGKKLLTSLIQDIREYTIKHQELATAHHFSFDLKTPTNGTPQYVVLGINPGETAACWRTAPRPTELTSHFDYHGGDRQNIRWYRMCADILTGADYVESNLFFWSSNNKNELKSRFGRLSRSRHLPFCTEKNKNLIEIYKPRAIIFAGVGREYMKLCREQFNLKQVSAPVKDGSHRIVENYTYGRTPWLFARHWTGSYGFSEEQKQLIIRELDRACQNQS